MRPASTVSGRRPPVRRAPPADVEVASVHPDGGRRHLVVLTAILVGCTLERLRISVGPGHLYVGQLVALACFPYAFGSHVALRVIRRHLAVFGLVLLVSWTPSVLFLPESGFRALQMAQMLLNCYVLVVTAGVALSISTSQLRRWVGWMAGAVAGAAVLQVFLQAASLAPFTSRVLGLPRPFLLFDEPTWLATMAAMLFAAGVALHNRAAKLTAGAIVLMIFTRAAIGVGVFAVLGEAVERFRWRAAARLLPLVPALAAGYFLYRTLTAPQPSRLGNSIDTRYLFAWVIRTVNGNNFWPLGGDVIHFQYARYIQVAPEVANMAGLDLAWKFGVAGLATLVIWSWLVGWRLPSVLNQLQSVSDAGLAARFALCALPMATQLNNSFGRPWMWVGVAVLLTTIFRCAEREHDASTTGQEAPRSGAEATPPA